MQTFEPQGAFTLHLNGASVGQRARYVLSALTRIYGWGFVCNQAGADAEWRLTLVQDGRTLGSGIAYSPHALLADGDTTAPDALCWGAYGDVPCPVGDDPLAGAFYLLSAYEEYFVVARDQHGRIPAASLRVVEAGFAERPLADRLLQAFTVTLCRNAGVNGVPSPTIQRPLSTLDIDSAAAVHGKPWPRKLAGLGRELLRANLAGAAKVVTAIRGGPDPFDTFAWLEQVHERVGLRPTVFMLLGYDTELDPGFAPGDVRYRQLTFRLQQLGRLGLHPSYETATQPALLANELASFKDLTSTATVEHTRQHFLRVAWPDTLRGLEDAGVRYDYSLGWPDALGFRLGTARAVPWYDLLAERTSQLTLVAPQAMDATARYYLRLSPKHFASRCEALDQECRLSGAGLHLIWHNSNLGPLNGWTPWRSAYEKILHAMTRS